MSSSWRTEQTAGRVITGGHISGGAEWASTLVQLLACCKRGALLLAATNWLHDAIESSGAHLPLALKSIAISPLGLTWPGLFLCARLCVPLQATEDNLTGQKYANLFTHTYTATDRGWAHARDRQARKCHTDN